MSQIIRLLKMAILVALPALPQQPEVYYDQNEYGVLERVVMVRRVDFSPERLKIIASQFLEDTAQISVRRLLICPNAACSDKPTMRISDQPYEPYWRKWRELEATPARWPVAELLAIGNRAVLRYSNPPSPPGRIVFGENDVLRWEKNGIEYRILGFHGVYRGTSKKQLFLSTLRLRGSINPQWASSLKIC